MTKTTTEQPAPPRAMRADARRNQQRVLAAARRCMARDGLDAQVEEIARSAKVGVGTVYRHYPNKEDLVEALAAARFERLAELADEAMADQDPWNGFVAFIRASVEIQRRDRALSEVLVSRPETMRRAAEGVDILGRVGLLIERAQDSGAMRLDAKPEDVPMFLCALAGICNNPLRDPDRYISIVLDGFRAPGETPLG